MINMRNAYVQYYEEQYTSTVVMCFVCLHKDKWVCDSFAFS